MILERCLHCFATHACELRFTRKGLPYTTCRVCRTRSFFHGEDALRGVAVAPVVIEATLRQVQAGDPSVAWVHERTAQLKKYVRDTMRGDGLPEATAEPVPYVEPSEAKERIA